MNERELREALQVAIQFAEKEWPYLFLLDLQDVSSFEDVGMMTEDEGLVVRFVDGSEFRITIQKV